MFRAPCSQTRTSELLLPPNTGRSCTSATSSPAARPDRGAGAGDAAADHDQVEVARRLRAAPASPASGDGMPPVPARARRREVRVGGEQDRIAAAFEAGQVVQRHRCLAGGRSRPCRRPANATRPRPCRTSRAAAGRGPAPGTCPARRGPSTAPPSRACGPRPGTFPPPGTRRSSTASATGTPNPWASRNGEPIWSMNCGSTTQPPCCANASASISTPESGGGVSAAATAETVHRRPTYAVTTIVSCIVASSLAVCQRRSCRRSSLASPTIPFDRRIQILGRSCLDLFLVTQILKMIPPRGAGLRQLTAVRAQSSSVGKWSSVSKEPGSRGCITWQDTPMSGKKGSCPGSGRCRLEANSQRGPTRPISPVAANIRLSLLPNTVSTVCIRLADHGPSSPMHWITAIPSGTSRFRRTRSDSTVNRWQANRSAVQTCRKMRSYGGDVSLIENTRPSAITVRPSNSNVSRAMARPGRRSRPWCSRCREQPEGVVPAPHPGRSPTRTSVWDAARSPPLTNIRIATRHPAQDPRAGPFAVDHR